MNAIYIWVPTRHDYKLHHNLIHLKEASPYSMQRKPILYIYMHAPVYNFNFNIDTMHMPDRAGRHDEEKEERQNAYLEPISWGIDPYLSILCLLLCKLKNIDVEINIWRAKKWEYQRRCLVGRDRHLLGYKQCPLQVSNYETHHFEVVHPPTSRNAYLQFTKKKRKKETDICMHACITFVRSLNVKLFIKNGSATKLVNWDANCIILFL